MKAEKHTLTMLVDNEPGVLSRVAGLFSGRGFNIDSLCVAETMDPKVSRITVVTQANEILLEQIEKQLRKLINVIKLRDMTGDRAIRRELCLICVNAQSSENRDEINRLVNFFRASVIDVGPEYYIIETVGSQEKISAFISLLKPLGIKKIARTGAIALYREQGKG
ncbi:MAG: acetolactate synthase small subunit [Desulfobacteraceae bacterium]|nr:acetolactate synthase small subunit [Desulfobacteraceae bacterium]